MSGMDLRGHTAGEAVSTRNMLGFRAFLSMPIQWSLRVMLAAPAIALCQVTEVEFQPSTVFLAVGQSRVLSVAVTPERFKAHDLDWSSQNESIARVADDGTLTAIRAGRTYVFAQGGVCHEANDMCRVVIYDDSNSTRVEAETAALDAPLKIVDDPTTADGRAVAWSDDRSGSQSNASATFDLTLQRDELSVLMCRIRVASGAAAAFKLQIDGGPELKVNASAEGGQWQDVSPMFMHPFGGFYRFGLTAGHHVLKLTLVAGDMRVDYVRLIGETDDSDRYASHDSTIMRQRRWYRIFLPPDYDATRDRLPVIYYLHGWGGRAFKEGVPGSHIDLGEVERRVKRDHVIFVMTDGQIFWEGGTNITRFAPYNIFLPHEQAFLWEDYFAEFVQHIDATYRTIPDRSQRTVFGFSMGGLISYRIAERFPHLVGAINPFCGSTEGFFGTPTGDTYVRIADAIENLHGVRLRIHDTASDYLKLGNDTVWRAAQREGLPQIEFALFPGTHAVDPAGVTLGFDQAFDWAVNGFRHPTPAPARWNAMEFIPKFDAWDYHVNSMPAILGITELHGVTHGGFRVATQSAGPDGPARLGASVDIVTAPIYRPGTDYEVFDYNETKSAETLAVARSDELGRIKISVDGEPHQIGIYRVGDPAEVVVLGGLAGQRGFLPVGREATIRVRLLNRGASVARGLKGFISSSEAGVTISTPDFVFDAIRPGEVVELSVPVVAQVHPPKYCAPFAVRFDIKVRSESGVSWSDEMDVIPFFAAPKFSVTIEDEDQRNAGHPHRNTAAPGGYIRLRANGRLLQVFTDDRYLAKVGDVPIIGQDDPENAAVYSELRVAPDCPRGHVVTCLVRTETVESEIRSVSLEWGRVEFEVR